VDLLGLIMALSARQNQVTAARSGAVCRCGAIGTTCTLHLRITRQSENALAIARYLAGHLTSSVAAVTPG